MLSNFLHGGAQVRNYWKVHAQTAHGQNELRLSKPHSEAMTRHSNATSKPRFVLNESYTAYSEQLSWLTVVCMWVHAFIGHKHSKRIVSANTYAYMQYGSRKNSARPTAMMVMRGWLFLEAGAMKVPVLGGVEELRLFTTNNIWERFQCFFLDSV